MIKPSFALRWTGHRRKVWSTSKATKNQDVHSKRWYFYFTLKKSSGKKSSLIKWKRVITISLFRSCVLIFLICVGLPCINLCFMSVDLWQLSLANWKFCNSQDLCLCGAFLKHFQRHSDWSIIKDWSRIKVTQKYVKKGEVTWKIKVSKLEKVYDCVKSFSIKSSNYFSLSLFFGAKCTLFVPFLGFNRAVALSRWQ